MAIRELILLAVITVVYGDGSGEIVQHSLDACDPYPCNLTSYCNVIYTDDESDSSECLLTCPSPSIANPNRVCQDYCSQPQNPCTEFSKTPYCHRQNTRDMYRCVESCNGVLAPVTTDDVCTDMCSPNPCASPKVCTPAANGNYTCSDSCESPRVEDAGKVCVDACNPNFCPSNQYCTRSGSSYECVDSCADYGLEIDGDSRVCKDFCNPNPCGDEKFCNSLTDHYECVDECPWPKLRVTNTICKDPCLPRRCAFVYWCVREITQRDCIMLSECPADHYLDVPNKICVDGCGFKHCEDEGKFCTRYNTAPGFTCTSNCSYPYTANGYMCVDPCYPINPCQSDEYCLRNGLNHTCVSKTGCPDKYYAKRKGKVCEDPCQENPCAGGFYCHRKGKSRVCKSECSTGFTPEKNNPFICEKVVTLEFTTAVEEEYTSSYDGGKNSKKCKNLYGSVMAILHSPLVTANAGKSQLRGCRPGSVLVDIATEFKSSSDDEPSNMTAQQLNTLLTNHYEELKNDSSVTYFPNGTMYIPEKNITVKVFDSTNVTDFDECETEDTHFCSNTTQCVNTPGSYICTCLPGYESFGTTCRNIDDCVNATHCHVNANCIDKTSGYSCVCKDGYTGNGNSCEDIDECSGNNECLVNQKCHNYQGGYICDCPAGQFNVSGSCKDVYTYNFSMTVYQDSLFDHYHFTKDKNFHLLDNTSNLYHTFGQEFCGMVTVSFEHTTIGNTYLGCRVTGYRLVDLPDTRRSTSGVQQIFISAETYYKTIQESDYLQWLLEISAFHVERNGFYKFHLITAIQEFPHFEAVCQNGRISKGDHCEQAPPQPLDECADGCADNGVCVIEDGNLLCMCMNGYVGDGKTDCKMTCINRLRWILIVCNSILLASLLVTILSLIRIRRRAKNYYHMKDSQSSQYSTGLFPRPMFDMVGETFRSYQSMFDN